jgi:hypothetical protein
MSRYTAGHRIVHAGSFVLPLFPVMLVTERYKHGFFEIGTHHFLLLWIAGLLLSYLLVLIHESGHILAARCVGIKITEMTIGHWRRLFTFRIGGLNVVIRAAPDSGFVRPESSRQLASAWRMAIFVSGGIAAEALVLFQTWQSLGFPRQVASFAELFAAFSFVMLLWLGALHVLTNLWPHQGTVGGSRLPTDGALLFGLWRSRHQRTNQAALIMLGAQIDGLIREGRRPEALEMLEEFRTRHPENPQLTQVAAHLYAELGDTHRSESLLRELLAQPLGAEKLAEILDSIACLPIYYDRPDLLHAADAWTNDALRLAPQAITLKGTRGSVLIELGRLDEGVALLREVMKQSECPLDHAISAAYLAKAHHLRGETADMRLWLAKAKSAGVDHRLVKRVVAELETNPAAA